MLRPSRKLLSRKPRDATERVDSVIMRFPRAKGLRTPDTGGTGWGARLSMGISKIDATILACFRVAGRSFLDGLAGYGAAFHGIHPHLHPDRDDGRLSLTQEERFAREIAAMMSYEEILFEEPATQDPFVPGRSAGSRRQAAQIRRRG